ncbi:MAG: hypothetical protein K0Q77_2118 [Anaerosporomusa subterranea]|nr:hypothetical protein [Anaerosporomusa subterranea]
MRKAFIVVLLVILATSIALVATWQTKSESVMADARGMLEQEVTKVLGGSVSVDAIEIQGISSVAITGISLLDKQGTVMATADSLTVAFNPILLLTGLNPVDAIHGVTIESPRLYLRQRADMGWNLADLAKDQESGGQQFGGLVRVNRGWLSVETQKQGNYQADNLNGTLDFAVKPSIQLDLKGNHNGAWFVVEGSVNGKSRDALTVSIDSLALPEYQAILPTNSVKITAGQAKNVTITLIREKEDISYSGEAFIQDLAGQADDIPVEKASGLVSFDHNTVHVYNADMHLWGQPLRLSGDITYRADQPVFDLSLAAEAFDAGALPVANGLSGLAAFDVHVKGTQSDFKAQGGLSIAAGRYQNYQFANAETQFVYSGGLLQLIGAKASLYDGQIAADGVIDLATMTSDLRLSGRQLDGALLASAAGLADTGARVDFDMLLRGKFALGAADATGTVTLGEGKMAGIPFKGGYGGFHLQQGILTADYLNAVVDSGMVSAKGSYDIRQDLIAVDVDSHNLPLQALTQTLPAALHASGSLQLTAKLTGKLADPRIVLALTAEHGNILSQPFERLTGAAEVSREKVILRNVQAVNGLTTHTIEGSIQLTGKKDLSLAIATRHARMENLLKPLSLSEVVTGNVEHDLSITGTLDNPSADGILALTEGSWRGYLLNSVKGAYRFRDGVVEIQDAVINSLDNQVIINGTVTTTGKLALSLNGSDIDLARLPVPYPYPVNGKAELAISLTGTLSNPQLTGQAIIPRLTANGQLFERVDASLNLNGSLLDFPSATFAQGQSSFSLTGGINLASEEIYGSLRVEKAQASAIAALAKLDDKVLQGEFSGYFTWNGTLANPNATFGGTVAKGVVKGYTIGDIELEASLTNHVIELEKLMVKQSDGLMAAKGKIDLRGDINIEAGARDIDAAFFAKLFDASIETKGKLSFTAQISGKTANPHTAVSLEIANGSIDNAGFDNLYGLFILNQGKIQVNQLLLSKGEYKASAYGVIPLAALNKEGRKEASAADEMDLTFRLDHANLSILPILSNAISTASGDTKGEVKVTGSLFQPNLNGQITVKDGTIKFIGIEEPIQKVTVDIQFKDDTIQLRTFEGAVGAGKYQLTGSAVVRDMALHDYDMSLMLDKVSLTHKYFKGPVNGMLTLSEKANMPHFAGKLLLANTTVNVPVVPLTSSANTTFDMGMDVELVVGEKVRLYNPVLYDVWVEGKVHFNGSLQQPDVSGKIESLRGTLNYLRTQFQINEATVAFTQFRSFEPVINLKASTRLEQTDVNLAVNGPVTAMNLKLTSDPQMSQQEILSLLTLREKFSERQASGKRDTSLGRDELVSMLDAGLQLQFFAEVEDMFRNSLGVDEFRVFRGSSSNPLFTSDQTITDQDQYKIEIGKYFTDRLLLRYTTGVNSSERSYGARYDITKSMSLTADVDEFKELQVGIGMRFRF